MSQTVAEQPESETDNSLEEWSKVILGRSEPEDDENAEIREHLNLQAREQKRLSGRPDIDHLRDAVVEVDGKLQFVQPKGTRVIIERFATVLSNRPWLDTRSYLVESVNQETGELKLQDEEMRHSSHSNFITASKLGYRFKVPETKGIYVSKAAKATKAQQKPEAAKPAKQATNNETERRIYSTKGQIHTRIKGIAYVPQGATQATDKMRLMTQHVGDNIKVRSVDGGWEEVWVPNKDM